MKRLSTAVLVTLLVACQPSDTNQETIQTGEAAPVSIANPQLCNQPAIPISEAQGKGSASPLEGKQATVRGVVTHVIPGQGLFIQQEPSPANANASHGLFVASPELAQARSDGEVLTLVGIISELGEEEDTLTSIASIMQFADCGQGTSPLAMDVRLPLSPGQRESLEGMRVMLQQPLTVTAVRNVPDGQIRVSADGLLRAPTEVALPGEPALEHHRRNLEASIAVHNDHLADLDPYTNIQAGARVEKISGVLGHDGRQIILLSSDQLDHVAQPAPAAEPASADEIRIVSYNLYEYFNGDGNNGGFPGERGAESLEAFESQSARIIAAIEQLRPDILGVMELENDGFGPESAIEHLRLAISEALDVEFAIATPESDRVGTDVINVGILYRPDRLEALGPAQTLEGETFGPLNRVPLAQAFADRSGSERLVVAVNHLKSKGWCPDSGNNTDQGDGQACWNHARVEGATQTVAWAESLAKEAGTEKYILVGDFNAYRMEDPVRAIEAAGLLEVVAYHQPGVPQFSYIYRGAAGTLDYAFASESLANISTRGFIWNINAAYPYSATPSQPWLRSSDHDPVVVDLRFNQASTSD